MRARRVNWSFKTWVILCRDGENNCFLTRLLDTIGLALARVVQDLQCRVRSHVCVVASLQRVCLRVCLCVSDSKS